MSLYSLKRFILDFLYPNRCPFCDKEIHYSKYFCTECVQTLSEPQELDCYETPFTAFISVTTYDDVSKTIISELKNNGNGYAMSAIAFLIYEKLLSSGLIGKIDYITAVPLHKHDMARRGYNQSEEIAKIISEISHIPYLKALKKNIRTKPQKELNSAERKINVIGAYSCLKPEKIQGENVLIIDDVCTTGSTLKETASQLIIGGASCVFAAVFAKTKNIP